MECMMRIYEKINHVITAPHCSSHMNMYMSIKSTNTRTWLKSHSGASLHQNTMYRYACRRILLNVLGVDWFNETWTLHCWFLGSHLSVKSGNSVRRLGKMYMTHASIFHRNYILYYVIISATASQITSLKIVYSTVYSDADQRKQQSSASLAFVRGISVNSPPKIPVTRKMFPFDDVIMAYSSFQIRYAQERRLASEDFHPISPLTHLPVVPQICFSELGQHWFW